MQTILTIIQIISALAVIAGVMLQDAGTGTEGALGGGGSSESAVRSTRRGFDKFSFDATLVMSTLLAASSLALVALF